MLEKGIAGLDIVSGLERYNGDERVYLKILSVYAGDVRSLLGSLASVSKDDLNDYRVKMHGIKGMSMSIFAEQIGDRALKLEEAAEAGDFVFIEENNPSFIEAVTILIDDIDETLKAVKTDIPKPVSDYPDKDLLLRLLNASEVFNMTEAGEVMEELEQFSYEMDDGLALWLREKVDTMRFMEIAEKLSAMI